MLSQDILQLDGQWFCPSLNPIREKVGIMCRQREVNELGSSGRCPPCDCETYVLQPGSLSLPQSLLVMSFVCRIVNVMNSHLTLWNGLFR